MTDASGEGNARLSQEELKLIGRVYEAHGYEAAQFTTEKLKERAQLRAENAALRARCEALEKEQERHVYHASVALRELERYRDLLREEGGHAAYSVANGALKVARIALASTSPPPSSPTSLPPEAAT